MYYFSAFIICSNILQFVILFFRFAKDDCTRIIAEYFSILFNKILEELELD